MFPSAFDFRVICSSFCLPSCLHTAGIVSSGDHCVRQQNGLESTTRALPTIMLGRMASAARLGTSGAADLSSEAATKDADATQAAAQGTSDDGPAGGTSAAAAATSVTTAAQQHPNLIGTIVGKMAKIQREGRGRRYRGLQAKMTEAIDAMNEFMGEEWPPEQEEEIAPPDWMDNAGDGADGGGLGNANTTISVGGAAGGATSGAGSADAEQQDVASAPRNSLPENNAEDQAAAPELTEDEAGDDQDNDEDNANAGDDDADADTDVVGEESTAAMTATTNGSGSATTATVDSTVPPDMVRVDSPKVNGRELVSSPVDDDPATREPMHPAVLLSLDAYCMALSHPLKTPKMAELTLECITILVENKYVSGRAGGRAEARRMAIEHAEATEALANAKASGDKAKVEEATARVEAGPPMSLLQRVADAVTRCSDSPSEVVQAGMSKCLLSMMTSPKCGVHEAPMLMAVRATFHIYLVAKSQQAKDVSKTTLLDMLKSVFNRMEAYDAMSQVDKTDGKSKNTMGSDAQSEASGAGADDRSQSASTTATAEGPDFSAFASQFHTDSYLLFRALCKLSAKTLPEDNASLASGGGAKVLQAFTSASAVDPLALSSKILSLELILATLEHCGPAFCNGEKFIYAVQHYLCVSLLKNCMSNHTEVAYLSLKIFLTLVYKFKSQLKSEIEVFVANIFLRILESPNSSYKQKTLVLEALRALCSDPVILTQLFLNYDCDFDAVNLYKDIIQNLTKLSGKSRRNQYNANVKEVTEDVALSVAGLEVLVVVLRAFLKALGLPGGDDNLDLGEDGTSSGLRGSLKLDVGLALRELTKTASSISDADDISVSVSDIERSSKDAQDANSSLGGATSGSNQSLNSLSKVPSNDDVAGKIVDAFDKKRTAQQNFQTGCVRFTLSLKSGLLYFIENGFVNLDAKEIALFLLVNKDKLDKTQIGEVLGKEPDSAFVKDEGVDAEQGGKGFFVRILHHYVDALEFADLLFDDAIRLFLSGFRLPGEAQKIDRIMEKFAEFYTRQNDDVFPSADTAFILAFSVIMLQTDLHNPSIKPEKRMTMEGFIRNNRGISVDGGDLPSEFLEGIFKRIQAKPFTLKEDDDARAKEEGADALEASSFFEAPGFFGASTEERKKEKFRKEREEMMAASEQLFKRRPNKSSAADKASNAAAAQLKESISPANVVKPMFDVTWGPLMGSLSQVLETSEDENSIALCLIAFVYSIRISAHSGMSLARDTFVNALAKFTTLGSIKEMKYKNIESIRTLLSIAIVDGDYLGESWGPVLQCVSQLGRLQLYASGLDSDDKFLNGPDTPNADGDAPSAGFFRSPTQAEVTREIEENNGRAILAAVNEILIDKVFSSTVNLSVTSMYHFIEQLIAVSMGEICGDSKRGLTDVTSAAKSSAESATQGAKPPSAQSGHGEGGPRIFSMQRLVEVADFNMNIRPRLAWAKMWEMMGNHFAKIGCQDNAMVSMYAIDALRQLSFKFLEKPELADFNFQRLFLRPFLDIMENPTSRDDIRELILRCVDNMIRSMSHNIRSGWKIFFSILTLSASDPSEKISTLGLAILQRLLDQHLDQLCRLTTFDDFDTGVVEAGGEEGKDPEQMTALEKRQRNANAEDFVGLCHASMSFVQTEESDNPLPIGLSMRALCHTACYADLIAEERVLPPVSGSQPNDPSAAGYTYEGLSEDEALQMVLWRPILDGLAAGICSTAPSSSGGVGCLVQRGSVITMRAILLRHGSMFSTSQWAVILRQVILPAIQIGAEYDASPVTSITSESPAVSSLDFLNDALPLPPGTEDEGLLKFAELAETDESAPTRPLGTAELLVEASFADLRHGGDGDLSKAHGLAKKDQEGKKETEQPFPDSWVATTAPVALGMLTDVFSEIVIEKGQDGRDILWPIILEQLQRWAAGFPLMKSILQSIREDDSEEGNESNPQADAWLPCESLVRIGCKELYRIPDKLLEKLPDLNDDDAQAWPKLLFQTIADTLTKNVSMESDLHRDLVAAKLRRLGLEPDGLDLKGSSSTKNDVGNASKADLTVDRVEECVLEDGRKMEIPVSKIKLEAGSSLYDGDDPKKSSKDEENDQGNDDDENDEDDEPSYLREYIPSLKIRCVASHCLQQGIPEVVDIFSHVVGQDEVSKLLKALEDSRSMSSKASDDEDLAHAFQEALLFEWGGGVEEVESTLASVGGILHKGGAEMFFLTQQAGADKAIIHILSQLVCGHSAYSWDTKAYAEPLLLDRMIDILNKFLISERDNAEFINPNVWRTASDSGGKIALYCTCFVDVCSSILETILNFDDDQFNRSKAQIYPIICSLIRVQSEEIRGLVQEIFATKVAAVLGIAAVSSLAKSSEDEIGGGDAQEE